MDEKQGEVYVIVDMYIAELHKAKLHVEYKVQCTVPS